MQLQREIPQPFPWDDDFIPRFDPRPPSFLGRAQRAQALNARAWELYERGEDLDLALSLVEEALRESPWQLCAHDTRARLLLALWRVDEAEASVRFIEETAPFFADSADLFTGREPILPRFFRVRDKALRFFAKATGLPPAALRVVRLSEGLAALQEAPLGPRAAAALEDWVHLILSFGGELPHVPAQPLFLDDHFEPMTVEAIEAILGG